ncbi:MAG: Uncharacterised protein [Methanobacteriota archaeon]|nr:MAG: Uncharacterised protein [Euryarchaeota archaeon]
MAIDINTILLASTLVVLLIIIWKLFQTDKSNDDTKIKSLASEILRDLQEDNSKAFLSLASERFKIDQTKASGELESRKKEVESLVNPISEQLKALEAATTKMEKEREGAYQNLQAQVVQLQKQTMDLGHTNTQLSTALRGSSKSRGKWGEIALKNIVEAAGMLNHCDFDVQEPLKSGKGGAIVDLLVTIPNGGHIPVDSKVPLAAYWDGLELEDIEARGIKMKEHAKALKKHINDLVDRDYPSLIEGVDFTVMFIPADPILSAAFEEDSGLQEYAFSKHVLITTPVTLLALLRTVGLYWQQQSMSENAKIIHSSALEFYNRVAKFSHDLAKMGRGMNTAINAYNDSVGAFDSSVIPSGRRIEQLKVTEGAQRKITELPSLTPTRSVKKLTSNTEEE